jgi:NADH:ubiquinone oxidoreductase subunit 5 (subunit L)/multisubunit Na+/H+ antiporter MnhA subunit
MRTLPRRLLSALVGGLLLLGTLIEGYFQSFGFYQEHYVWPKVKYGVLTPLRWQDIVFLVAFWVIAAALFYLSYRLLRHAFRREPPRPANRAGGPDAAA